MTKLSIIVPIYNSEKYLQRCVDSLIGQTLDDIEIILVNDASTDNSIKIMKEYKNDFPNKVTIIDSKVNKKQGAARNLGLQIAKGDYISFVDSDDWIRLDTYAKCYKVAYDNNADIVCFDALRTKNGVDGTYLRMISENNIGIIDEKKRKSLILKPGSCWCKIYNRKILIDNEIIFPENISYEDNCFNYIPVLYIKNCYYIQEALYMYFLNENSTTSPGNFSAFFDRCIVARLLIDEVVKRGFYNSYKEEFDFIFCLHYYFSTGKACLIGFNKVYIKKLLELQKYIKRNYPDFSENKYYKYNYSLNEKRFILLMTRFPFLISLFYMTIRIVKFIFRPIKNKVKRLFEVSNESKKKL